MCLLALAAVTLAAIDLTSEAAEWEVTADRIIYWIFVLDYALRFSFSRSKWIFVKEHVWDLLAIVPFDVLFRLFRFASLGEILRLARYLDLFSYAMRFTTRIRRFFNTNGFKYICIAALVIILLGAVGILLAEDMSLPNGIWWSFVTATTVGYGDTYPVTTPGRFLAVFLMLTGIGFVGTLTSTITSFFLHPHEGDQTWHNMCLQQVFCLESKIRHGITDAMPDFYYQQLIKKSEKRTPTREASAAALKYPEEVWTFREKRTSYPTGYW